MNGVNTSKWVILCTELSIIHTQMTKQWLRVFCFSRVRMKDTLICNFLSHSFQIIVHYDMIWVTIWCSTVQHRVGRIEFVNRCPQRNTVMDDDIIVVGGGAGWRGYYVFLSMRWCPLRVAISRELAHLRCHRCFFSHCRSDSLISPSVFNHQRHRSPARFYNVFVSAPRQ